MLYIAKFKFGSEEKYLFNAHMMIYHKDSAMRFHCPASLHKYVQKSDFKDYPYSVECIPKKD